MRDLWAKPTGSWAKASKKKRGDREVESAIKAWSLLAAGLKATGRNRRVSVSLSPTLTLFASPYGQLFLRGHPIIT
jgi:hypothetical protein